MNEVKSTVLTICVVLIAAEIIARLVPKNRMIGFVRSLIITLLLLSVLKPFVSAEIDLGTLGEETAPNTELTDYVNESYEGAVQQEMSSYIAGLLQTIQVETKEIRVLTDIKDEASISIEKIEVTTRYESDRERAKALLESTVGKDLEVEVKSDGS